MRLKSTLPNLPGSQAPTLEYRASRAITQPSDIDLNEIVARPAASAQQKRNTRELRLKRNVGAACERG